MTRPTDPSKLARMAEIWPELQEREATNRRMQAIRSAAALALAATIGAAGAVLAMVLL